MVKIMAMSVLCVDHAASSHCHASALAAGRDAIKRGSGGRARASSGCRWRSCGSCGHGCAGCRRASRCGRGSTPAVGRSITASIAAPPRCSAGARPEPGCGAGAARHAGAPSRRQRGRRWRASAGRRRSSRCWRTCWARPRAPAGFSRPARAEPDDGLALADAHSRGVDRGRGGRARRHRGGRREVLPEARKGSREWVNHQRDPARFPKPDRPRWRDHHLGLSRPVGTSKYQVPVLTIVDRAGAPPR